MLETINSTKNDRRAERRGLDRRRRDRRYRPLAPAHRELPRRRPGRRALRFLRIAGGGEIEDRVDEIDHQRRRFRYTRTRSPFPVKNYVGTVEVRHAPKDRSEVSWTVDIDVAPEAKDEMVALLSGALSDLISGIEREVQQEAASR